MELEEIVAAGLGVGEAAIVLASRSRSLNCRLANNTVTTNGQEESTSAGVVAIEGEGVGVQAADVQEQGQVARLAAAARVRAAASPPAPDAMPLLSQDSCGASAEEPPKPAALELEPIVQPLQAALERSRRAGTQLYGYAHLREDLEMLGTATGVHRQGQRRVASLSLTLKTADLRRSVWSGTVATEIGAFDVTAMHRALEERLGWTENQIQLEAGHYQVILEPSATADMVLRLGWEMHARGADEDRTVFSGQGRSRVGERMYSALITIESDPGDPGMHVPDFVRALHSSEYSSIFDNGLPVGPTSWVEEGVQRDLICPRRWAKDHGHPVRPDAENLRLKGTDTTLAQMIAETERALLITSFWYIRDVDPSTLLLTGLTRDGVFLVERGKVVGAVNNFRFNESPVGVLARTVEVGRAELALSREAGDAVFIAAPPLRVDGFFMSSVSDAV